MIKLGIGQRFLQVRKSQPEPYSKGVNIPEKSSVSNKQTVLTVAQIEQTTADLYQNDKSLLGELLSACIDPSGFYFADIEAINKLKRLRLLTPGQSLAPNVREVVSAKYHFLDE